MPAPHLRKAFDPAHLQKIASEMERRRIALGADLVVVRGLSGVMVATAMSLLHQTPIAIVRKPTENSHGNSIEVVRFDFGSAMYRNWMIVDDLIATGTTVREIHRAFANHASVDGECVAIGLYDNDRPSEGEYNVNGVSIPTFHIGRIK